MASSEKFDLIVRARDEASAKINGIARNVVGMVAAFASVRAVGQFLTEATQAAIESERVYNDLAVAIERHGGQWANLETAIRSFTGTLQLQTGLSDEAIARSIQVFIDYGANAQQAMNRVKVAADLAVGANMSLESATDLVSKASVGYTSTLSRYGIIIDESIPKSQKFAAAIDQINERFGGAAQARMSTTAGQLALLSELYGDLQENIGKLVAGPLLGLVQTLNDLLTIVNSNISAWVKWRTILNFFTTDPKNIALALAEMAANAAIVRAQADAAAESMKDFNNTMGGPDGTTAKVGELSTALKQDLGPGFNDYSLTVRNAAEALGEYNRMQDLALGGSRELSDGQRQAQQAAAEAAQEIERRYAELRGFVEGHVQGMISNTINQFIYMRDSIDKIFGDILKSFLSMIAQMIAQRAAAKVTDFLLAGPLSFLGLGLGKPSLAAATGAGAASVPTNQAMPRPVVVNINGPVIGEDEWVRKSLVPTIERDARLFHNSIAVRN